MAPVVHATADTSRVPEISPQVDDLPRTQADQHAYGPERKPLHPLIRALVGIPQLLLAVLHVFHLADDLLYQLFDASQLRLDRLQLLARLYRGPVFRVGADVDVELDVAVRIGDFAIWRKRKGGSQLVFRLMIGASSAKGAGRGKSLCVSMFSKQTSKAESAAEWKAYLFSPTTSLGLPYSLPIASLICQNHRRHQPPFSRASSSSFRRVSGWNSYMHVQHHPIPFAPAHRGRDHDQGISRDEVAYAALEFGRFGAWVSLHVELERG